MRQAGLERLDFALSRVALGKEDARRRRRADGARLQRIAAGRPELGVVVTDAQLDRRHRARLRRRGDGRRQVGTGERPRLVRVGRRARTAALASLPRVLVVAPARAFDTTGAEVLEIDDDLAEVSSTAAPGGRRPLIVARARRRAGAG